MCDGTVVFDDTGELLPDPSGCARSKRTPALRAGVALPLRVSAGSSLRSLPKS
ncbi:DUF5999 family protein [Streptomyces paradoxus]|uniref:DUF5999 family protein n=1 Tax=Streptomyces paradoxus TaxID=66375 RepID=UPI0036FD88DB